LQQFQQAEELKTWKNLLNHYQIVFLADMTSSCFLRTANNNLGFN